MIRQNDRSLIHVKKRVGIQYKKYWIPVFLKKEVGRVLVMIWQNIHN